MWERGRGGAKVDMKHADIFVRKRKKKKKKRRKRKKKKKEEEKRKPKRKCVYVHIHMYLLTWKKVRAWEREGHTNFSCFFCL